MLPVGRKPGWVFDRDFEWDVLANFAGSPSPRARLGVVSGRRRQGKTFLLRALAETVGAFYYAAAETTAAESLRDLGGALAVHTGGGAAVCDRGLGRGDSRAARDVPGWPGDHR